MTIRVIDETPAPGGGTFLTVENPRTGFQQRGILVGGAGFERREDALTFARARDRAESNLIGSVPSSLGSFPGEAVPPPPPNSSDGDVDRNIDNQGYNWLGNSLTEFESVTYNWSLYVVNDLAAFELMNANSIDEFIEAKQNVGRIVIAESGATAGFNISRVEMTSAASLSINFRNTFFQQFTIQIHEPYGTQFIDKILASCSELNVQNYTNCPFFLELTFKGYDKEGNFVDNIGAYGRDGRIQNQRWVYPIKILKIDSDLSSGGTNYTLDCITYDGHGFANRFSDFNESVVLEAGTVGEFFEALKISMTESEISEYGYSRNIFDFNILPLPENQNILEGINPDVKSWAIKKINDNEPSTTAPTYNENLSSLLRRYASTPSNMNLSALIDFLFSNIIEAQKLAGRSHNPEIPGNEADNAVAWRLSSTVRGRGDLPYDWVWNDYNYNITFNIIPYVYSGGMLSGAQRSDAENDDTNEERIINYIEREVLHKRYDYIFTGLNTEIRDVKVDYQFHWNAIVPRYADISSSSSTLTSSRGLIDDELRTEAIRIQEAIQDRNEKISEIETEIENLQENLEETEDAGEQARINSVIADRQRRISVLEDISDLNIERINRQISESISRGDLIGRGERFSEDLNTSNINLYPITFLRESARTDTEITDVTESGLSRGRSVYGLFIHQIMGQSSLNSLNLEIRGDPYWIGNSSIENRFSPINVSNPGESELPVFSSYDYPILFVFRYPLGVDENTGQPIFKKADIFNGIYIPAVITSIFDGGVFYQKLDCFRNINMVPKDIIQ